jgi:hypothetical protein
MASARTIAFAGLLLATASYAEAKDKKIPSPPSATSTAEANALADQRGEKMRRTMDAQNKRWDVEMQGLMKSICRGC